jgi:hypothetical protein
MFIPEPVYFRNGNDCEYKPVAGGKRYEETKAIIQVFIELIVGRFF